MVKIMAVVQTSNNLVVNRIVLADDDNSFAIANHTLIEETEATGEACIAGTWNGSVFVLTQLMQDALDNEGGDE